MNRLPQLFSSKTKDVLSIYFTAGYPAINDTVTILQHLQDAGVDFVEIGMPFSDPVADGPTIQRSSEIALENGMSIKLLFQQLKEIRKTISMPLILMGYINPVLQFGMEEFCHTCAEIGIDGLILPDMPMQIYLEEYKATFDKYDIRNIFLITPQSSDERVKWIDANSDSFIYMVSSYSTTGKTSGFGQEQIGYFERIQALKIKNPTVVGFGIASHDDFATATNYANGAIIGSAFVKAIGSSKNLGEDIHLFVKKIKATL